MATKDVTTRVVLETVEEVTISGARLKDELVRKTGRSVREVYSALTRAVGGGYLDWTETIWDSRLNAFGKNHLESLRIVDAEHEPGDGQ